jgi:hypothetical protein
MHGSELQAELRYSRKKLSAGKTPSPDKWKTKDEADLLRGRSDQIQNSRLAVAHMLTPPACRVQFPCIIQVQRFQVLAKEPESIENRLRRRWN